MKAPSERISLFQTKFSGELLRGVNLYATLVMRPIHGPKRFLIPPDNSPIFSSVLHSPQEVGRRSVSGGTAVRKTMKRKEGCVMPVLVIEILEVPLKRFDGESEASIYMAI